MWTAGNWYDFASRAKEIDKDFILALLEQFRTNHRWARASIFIFKNTMGMAFRCEKQFSQMWKAVAGKRKPKAIVMKQGRETAASACFSLITWDHLAGISSLLFTAPLRELDLHYSHFKGGKVRLRGDTQGRYVFMPFSAYEMEIGASNWNNFNGLSNDFS